MSSSYIYDLFDRLNGGPGCSSMDGLWLEVGPFKLNGDRNSPGVKINPHSWHNVANILFVDQPVGTGLSFTSKKEGLATNDETINIHFYSFLKSFFEIHTEYTSLKKIQLENGKDFEQMITRPLFITGESHAGHYIPSMSTFILKMNEKVRNDPTHSGLVISLEGIALGNPCKASLSECNIDGLRLISIGIDPINQYDVSEYAHGMGLISSGQKNKMKDLEKNCKSLLSQKKYNQAACFSLLEMVVDSSTVSGAKKVLMYDIRKFMDNPQLFPPGHEDLEVYLNRKEVRNALHATRSNQKYVECADPPFYALNHQDGKGVTKELVELLEMEKVRVLVYAGQYDMVCHHLGIEKALNLLNWSGRSGWLQTKPGVWLIDNKPAGYIRSFKSLQSLLNAGHMVPLDLPRQALDMISKFINNRQFGSGYSKIGVSFPNDLSETGTLRQSFNSTEGERFAEKLSIKKMKRKSLSAKSTSGGVHPKPAGAIRSRDLSGEPFINHKHKAQLHLTVLRVLTLTSSVIVRVGITHVASHISSTPKGKKLRLGGNNSSNILQISESTYHEYDNLFGPYVWVLALHPSNVEVVLNLSRINTSQPIIDLWIVELRNGHDHHLSVRKRAIHSNHSAHQSHNQPHEQSMGEKVRQVSLRAGCYSKHTIQCCGKGECVPNTNSVDNNKQNSEIGESIDKLAKTYRMNPLTTIISQSQLFIASSNSAKLLNDSVCSCEGGYSGKLCDQYETTHQTTIRKLSSPGSDVTVGSTCQDSALFPDLKFFLMINGTSGAISP